MAWWNRAKAKVEEDEGNAPNTPETPKPAEPNLNEGYVSREQFESVQNQLNQLTNIATAALGEGGGGNQPPAPEDTDPPIEDVTNEQINTAWAKARESGEPDDILAAKRLDDRRHNANLLRLQRDSDKKIKELESKGMGAIGQLNERNARLWLKEQDYYQDFKTEIEEEFDKLNPSVKNEQGAQAVYNFVLGNNTKKIIDKELETRERAKQLQEEGGGLDTNGRSGRGADGGSRRPGARFAEIFGEQVAQPDARWGGGGQLWQGRHSNPDQFAQNLGYGSADEYAEAGEAIMSVEDCPHCFMPMIETIQGNEHKCKAPQASHRLSMLGTRMGG